MLHKSISAAEIIPPRVILVETNTPQGLNNLTDDEQQIVMQAARERQVEFATGRACAKTALSRLGITGFPILQSTDRMPRWPHCTVGSITHTRGYCAAVVSRKAHYRSIGIDAEHVDRVEERIWPSILTDREHLYVNSFPHSERRFIASVFFSAKEAYYKCQYPITKQQLDFQDVTITLLSRGAFLGHYNAESTGANSSICGRFICLRCTGTVITLALLPEVSTNGFNI